MCGRYATTRSTAQLRETFKVAADHADEVTRQDYNMAPTKRAPIVLSAQPPDAGRDTTARQIRLAIWGLRPAWMTDPKPLSTESHGPRAQRPAWKKPAHVATPADRSRLLIIQS
jgi:putative SOS response-associated peptidase YedK